MWMVVSQHLILLAFRPIHRLLELHMGYSTQQLPVTQLSQNIWVILASGFGDYPVTRLITQIIAIIDKKNEIQHSPPDAIICDDMW